MVVSFLQSAIPTRVTVNWEEVFMTQLGKPQKMASASIWGKPIMTILNPPGKSPTLHCSYAAIIQGRNVCRFFCTGMIALIKSHFLYHFKCQTGD
jgi:hypothetical protein